MTRTIKRILINKYLIILMEILKGTVIGNLDNYFKVKVKLIRCNFLYIKLYQRIQ